MNIGITGTGLLKSFLLASVCVLPAFASAQAEDAPQDFWHRDTITGDWGGTRSGWSDRGFDISITDMAEALGIVDGGFDQGISYENRLDVSFDVDFEKMSGWAGSSAHATFYVIGESNGQPAADYVGSIADPSNIEAAPSTRLFTAWFQQNFADNAVSLRIGQIAADDEFFISATAGGLIDSTFGYATLLAADQVQGGPVYPMAVPGVRLQWQATEEFSLMAGLWAGAPAGEDCNGNPQRCNDNGFLFPTDGGTLWLGELWYGVNQGKNALGLPGLYKLGGWYASTDFADQRFGLDAGGNRVSLASLSAVAPLNHKGNWGIYGVIDQTIMKDSDGPHSVSLFLRGGVSPSDRNLVSAYIDGGFGINAPFAGRDDDVLTFGFAYTGISDDASGLDRDIGDFFSVPYPIRDQEMVYELDYALQIAPWWTAQFDAQYITNPGGNSLDPVDPTHTIDDAFILGIRNTLAF